MGPPHNPTLALTQQSSPNSTPLPHQLTLDQPFGTYAVQTDDPGLTWLVNTGQVQTMVCRVYNTADQEALV